MAAEYPSVMRQITGIASDRPLILCYHAVSDAFDSGLAVTRDRMRHHMRILTERGHRSVTLGELERMRQRGVDTSDCVAITFDDGYKSMLTARDLLSEFGFVGTVFVLPPTIGSGRPLRWPGIEKWADGPEAREFVPLDWSEVETLRGSGWEIGSHTLSHKKLTDLTADRVDDELGRSREMLIERLGACATVAYPYGDANDEIADAARRAGYEAGATLSPWHTRDTSFLRPRIGIFHRDSDRRFRWKIAGWTRSVRALPQIVTQRGESVGNTP